MHTRFVEFIQLSNAYLTFLVQMQYKSIYVESQ